MTVVHSCWSAYLVVVIFHRKLHTKNGFTFCTKQKNRNFANNEMRAQGRVAFTQRHPLKAAAAVYNRYTVNK